MSASNLRLSALADVLDVGPHHRRDLDGRLIALCGSLGQIKPSGRELLVTIQKPAAALVRQLLGLAVLDVNATGDLVLRRMPNPIEAPVLRDLLGVARRRT